MAPQAPAQAPELQGCVVAELKETLAEASERCATDSDSYALSDAARDSLLAVATSRYKIEKYKNPFFIICINYIIHNL